jgi:site-specific DNA-cytosine methylase
VNELALFCGAGGGLLGARLLGWRTVCGVELDPYCREFAIWHRFHLLACERHNDQVAGALDRLGLTPEKLAEEGG